MTTGQLLIYCGTALIAIAIVAGAALTIARDATTTRVVLERQRADAAASVASEELTRGVTALRQATAALYAHSKAIERGPSLVGKSLVVHTRKPDDQSVRGVVAAHYADRLVLRDAQYLHRDGAQPAGGVVDVLLINVSTWQEIAPPAAEEPA